LKALYFDTSYLVRLYLDDKGCEQVRALAAQGDIASCWHAQAEILCSLHRALREGRLDVEAYQAQRDQFSSDQEAEACQWLPLTDGMLARLDLILGIAPASTFLRAADALHLACAAENGFTEVHSNDRHFLAASPLFGLRGVDVIHE
jgi:predicted nucleic acid-binding protein